MTRNELLAISEPCIEDLRWVVDWLTSLEWLPSVDEDYKVERQPKYTKEFFDGLKALTSAVSQHCSQESSPFR